MMDYSALLKKILALNRSILLFAKYFSKR